MMCKTKWTLSRLVGSTLVLGVALCNGADAAAEKGKVGQAVGSISAKKIYLGNGKVIEDGSVSIDDGKIDGVSGGGSEEVYAITPGLIDLGARAGANLRTVEQSKEVTARLSNAEALDPWGLEWDRLVRTGVTTVLATPMDMNVVGGLSQVVKTAGRESIAARTLKKDAVLRGAMGAQPSQGNSPAFGRPTDFFKRRPTTRMGVEWEWRNAFHQTALGQNEGAERETLTKALKGELPMSIAAWTTQDIRTAIFAIEEVRGKELFQSQGLNKPRVFLDAAAEAWKEPELLVRSGIAVVLPPFTGTGRTREGAFLSRSAPEELRKAGITFALSAHGSGAYDSSLAVQAGAAMSGGLPFEEALKAVTSTPAKLVGVEARTGTIEEGKDADLALWNGEPFQPTSRVVAVIVDGVLVWDGRE